MSTQTTTPKELNRRGASLKWIIPLGVLAVIGSFVLRNSDWAREKRLKTYALDDLALAIHDTPDDPLVLFYYGSKLMDANQIPAAEKAFEGVVAKRPNMLKAVTGLATAQLRQGKLQPAMEGFEKAIKLDPNCAEALLGLSQTYVFMGSPTRATPALERVVKLEPNHKLAWYYLGRLYGDSHQSDKSYAALKRATELSPDNAAAWRDLGQVSMYYSKYEEAEGYLKKAIKLAPGDAIAFQLIGQSFAKRGTDPRMRAYAEQAFLGAAERDPQLADAQFELGQLYERSKNWKLAASRYRRATKLNPSDDTALLRLGMCLIRSGQVEEGRKLMVGAQKLEAVKREIDHLEKRAVASPNDIDLHVRLARTYKKYGNLDGASIQLKMALQLKEDPALRAELNSLSQEPGPADPVRSTNDPGKPSPSGTPPT